MKCQNPWFTYKYTLVQHYKNQSFKKSLKNVKKPDLK